MLNKILQIKYKNIIKYLFIFTWKSNKKFLIALNIKSL